MLERHLRRGNWLLDVGTGSGVLLVAGALLGAARGLGIDNDPLAVMVAAQNLAQNGTNSARFGVAAGNLVQPVAGRFDVVVANILAEVIVALSGDLRRVMRSGGLFIGSGIITSAEPEVCLSLEAAGLNVVERQCDQEWVCLVAKAWPEDVRLRHGAC
jgi:ribosomal protein L11 methyltransferase